MKRGHSTKEIWLSAKGEKPSFRISPHAGSTGERNVMAHRNHRNATSRPSIYQTVTDRIIASLKAGVIPWEKPWKTQRYAGGESRSGKKIRRLERAVRVQVPPPAPQQHSSISARLEPALACWHRRTGAAPAPFSPDVLICRCPAGAFFAANLRAQAAAGGCSSCSVAC